MGTDSGISDLCFHTFQNERKNEVSRGGGVFFIRWPFCPVWQTKYGVPTYE